MSSLDFRNAVVSSVVEWAKGREDFKVMLENGKTLDFETDESPKVSVEIVFEPPWTVDNMSEELQLKLGLL